MLGGKKDGDQNFSKILGGNQSLTHYVDLSKFRGKFEGEDDTGNIFQVLNNKLSCGILLNIAKSSIENFGHSSSFGTFLLKMQVTKSP